MPKARRSKSQRKKRRLLETPPAFDVGEDGVIRILPDTLERFKTDDRFIAMMRVARLTNALNYTFDRIVEAGQDSHTPAEWRTTWRNLFNAGGYVFEGLALVESLENDHGTRTYYRGFRDILRRTDYGRRKEIARVIRNSAAFHLDHHDRSTRKGLEGMVNNGTPYQFVSGEDDTLGALYFNIADLVDINYLIDEFKGDREDENEVLAEIQMTVISTAGELARAAEQFARGIALRIGLV